MPTLSQITAQATRVEDRLGDRHKWFLAHLPYDPEGETETLAAHMKLVLGYFERICRENDLDIIVERLIAMLHPPSERAAIHAKTLFVEAVAFHDVGKVNPNFQAKKMKNGLKTEAGTLRFRYNPHAVDTQPAWGHSEIGAVLFTVHQAEEIGHADFSQAEKVFLTTLVVLLSDSILLHHASGLREVASEDKTSVFEKAERFMDFLEMYNFHQPGVATKVGLLKWNRMWEQMFSTKHLDAPFALFALLRLNFSLLTAADYLATGEYMNDRRVDKMGFIGGELRSRMIRFARMDGEEYNAKAYKLAEQPDFEVKNPTKRSGDNLNQLRTEMAVEVIRTVRANLKNHFFYLEAPTGGGKTNLSMLACAELLDANPDLTKVFYVFPFTTLITQTHAVIKKTLGLTDDEIALMHSRAGFQTKKRLPEDGTSQNEPDGRDEEEEDGFFGDEKNDFIDNLFAFFPVCLLTHIRFFDLLKSNRKEATYGMHRLANSIVIIDELQSYSPSEWDKVLFFIANYAPIFNMRFVLMSATLPKISDLDVGLENRPPFVDLLPEPHRYFTNPNFCKRVQFRFDLLEQTDKIELADLAQTVLEKSKTYASTAQHGSVYTIIEFIFKKAATEFEAEIKKLETSVGQFFDYVFVLSGTIIEPRRREVIHFLKNQKNRSKNVLLITTQVVEAGVDIDMDLGFKNVSLIDSDEQLAGRVNRNVLKDPCEVWLFNHNESRVIYGKDLRYKVTRDELAGSDDHREILKKKDFMRLYGPVLKKIDALNNKPLIENFNSSYLPNVARLNFKDIHKDFKLIDSDNLSVFVPLRLPVKNQDLGASNLTVEGIFSESERDFLKKVAVWQDGDEQVDGAEVWRVYRNILGKDKKDNFLEQKIDVKTIQGILTKFTFSIFNSKGLRASLESFCNPEKGLEEYLYLSHHAQVYEYETGLHLDKLQDSENCII